MRYAIGVFSFPYPFLGLRLENRKLGLRLEHLLDVACNPKSGDAQVSEEQTLVDGSFASPGRSGLVGMAQERPRPLSMDVVVQAIVSHSPDDLEKLKAAGCQAAWLYG